MVLMVTITGKGGNPVYIYIYTYMYTSISEDIPKCIHTIDTCTDTLPKFNMAAEKVPAQKEMYQPLLKQKMKSAMNYQAQAIIRHQSMSYVKIHFLHIRKFTSPFFFEKCWRLNDFSRGSTWVPLFPHLRVHIVSWSWAPVGVAGAIRGRIPVTMRLVCIACAAITWLLAQKMETQKSPQRQH